MRKRSITALLAALAVVVLGFFASFFLIFSDDGNEQYAITLPGQGTAFIDPSPEISDSNRTQLQAVQVDRTNILSVIGRLQRPESYHLQSETTFFYRDTFTVLKSQLWKAGDRIRISQLNSDETPGQQVILTQQWAYLWDNDTTPTQFARQDRDADLYRRGPTYEDLLTLPPEAVLEGSVTELDGQLCLYAKTKDPLTGEVEQWYILSENGLLFYAAGELDGTPTYQMQISDLALTVEDETLFLLPDGTPAS